MLITDLRGTSTENKQCSPSPNMIHKNPSLRILHSDQVGLVADLQLHVSAQACTHVQAHLFDDDDDDDDDDDAAN